ATSWASPRRTCARSSATARGGSTPSPDAPPNLQRNNRSRGAHAAGAAMNRPLQGVKVVEVAMWAFVPAAGGMLSDMGASVIKIEPPTGDPLRGLKIQGANSPGSSFDMSWEAYNRGKRSLTLDLRREGAREVLYKLVADADVFLTSLLPPARRKM